MQNPKPAEADRFARYPSLKDRVVLITGGASGIGASIVEHFAKQQSRVCFFDVNESAGECHAKRVQDETGAQTSFTRVDLKDTAALQNATAKLIKDFGAITILINNAANDDRHETDKVTPEYWDDRISVNLKHQFFTAQAVLPAMITAGGGSIVNVSSIGWLGGLKNATVYNIAKAGILGMTKSLAREYGEKNVRVNCVLPGAIITERQREKWLTPEGYKLILSGQCLQEHLLPPDVARLILWLAADDSRLVTNQKFIIDAGWT